MFSNSQLLTTFFLETQLAQFDKISQQGNGFMDMIFLFYFKLTTPSKCYSYDVVSLCKASREKVYPLSRSEGKKICPTVILSQKPGVYRVKDRGCIFKIMFWTDFFCTVFFYTFLYTCTETHLWFMDSKYTICYIVVNLLNFSLSRIICIRDLILLKFVLSFSCNLFLSFRKYNQPIVTLLVCTLVVTYHTINTCKDVLTTFEASQHLQKL